MDEVPLSSILVRGLVVLALVAANAFFVSAEYSLAAARRARLDERARAGDPKAKRARRAIQSLNHSIAASKVGITLASIGLVWVAAPAVAALLDRVFGAMPDPLDSLATPAAAIIATFAAVALLHVIFGELIPRAIALEHPEGISRWIAGPLVGFVAVSRPLVRATTGTANALLRLVGIRLSPDRQSAHNPDEIMSMVRQSQASGQLDTQDVRLIEGVLEFTEKTARDVMTPRTDVISLDAAMTVEEAATRIAQAGRSRYPLIRESLDDIVGIVHAKQVLSTLQSSRYQTLDALMQDALFVPGSREVEDLLTDMQRLKRHMAIVLDEYGGTAGIVTMEDILEEIVGQIFDEYDEPEPTVSPTADAATMPGGMELDEANERFHLDIASDDYTTVGGYVFGALGRLPSIGDRVSVASGTLEVVEMEERRVALLRLIERREDGAGP